MMIIRVDRSVKNGVSKGDSGVILEDISNRICGTGKHNSITIYIIVVFVVDTFFAVGKDLHFSNAPVFLQCYILHQ